MDLVDVRPTRTLERRALSLGVRLGVRDSAVVAFSALWAAIGSQPKNASSILTWNGVSGATYLATVANAEDAGPEEDIETILEQLGDDETRHLLLDLAARHDDATRAIRRAAASPPGRVALLRTDVDKLRTRRHLGYRESIEWAQDATPVIDDIATEARSAPSRELLELIELTLGRVIKIIHHADDSSGMIGDLAHELLLAHGEACDAGVADPKALARWMVRFGLDDQDFFAVDPVRYAAALGEEGLAAYRQAVADRWAGGGSDFAIQHALERLAVLDGDIDRIVSLLGGDLTMPHQFIRVAEAMLGLDRADDALAWATRGIESTSGWQVAKLYDIAADVVAAGANDAAGVLDLRREQHQRMPSASTYATLREVASAAGVWVAEQAAARDILAEYDVGGFVDALLAEGDVEKAWGAATTGRQRSRRRPVESARQGTRALRSFRSDGRLPPACRLDAADRRRNPLATVVMS